MTKRRALGVEILMPWEISPVAELSAGTSEPVAASLVGFISEARHGDGAARSYPARRRPARGSIHVDLETGKRRHQHLRCREADLGWRYRHGSALSRPRREDS